MYTNIMYRLVMCILLCIVYNLNVRCIPKYLYLCRFLFWFVTGKLCTDVVSIYRINKSYPVPVSVL